jgi:hypothetical protein
MYYPGDYEGVKNLLARLSIGERRINASSGKQFVSRINFDPRLGRIAFFNVEGSTIRMYTLNGKAVVTLSPPAGRFSMDVKLFHKGMYLVTIESRRCGLVKEIVSIL